MMTLKQLWCALRGHAGVRYLRRDAAGHNDDDCPLCSAEHALLNTRESLTEARRVREEGGE